MHYYDDLSSFFLLIKGPVEIQSEVREQYRIKQNRTAAARPNNVHLLYSLSLLNAVVPFSCVQPTAGQLVVGSRKPVRQRSGPDGNRRDSHLFTLTDSPDRRSRDRLGHYSFTTLRNLCDLCVVFSHWILIFSIFSSHLDSQS